MLRRIPAKTTVTTFAIMSWLLLGCVSQKHLAESCLEKGKIYRSLGSLKMFFDGDTAYLARLQKLSARLPDPWILRSVESGDVEIRIIDWTNSVDDSPYSITFGTSHRHIVHPTFPTNTQVKLPCSVEISIEGPLLTPRRVSGSLNLEVRVGRGRFQPKFGYWEWNEKNKRIAFTEEGANTPLFYWEF